MTENVITILSGVLPTCIMVNDVRYVPEDRTVLDLVPDLISLGHCEQLVLLRMDEERWTSCKDIAAETGLTQAKVKVAQQKMTRLGIAHLDFLKEMDGEEMRGRGYLLTQLGTKLKREAEAIIERCQPQPRPEAAPTGKCNRAPKGWWCSRAPDHDGPCAARLKRSTKPLITDAVLLLLSEGDKSANAMAADIMHDKRFERLRARWGRSLSKHQVYAAMGGLRSKTIWRENLIEPANGGDPDINKVYRITDAGRARLRDIQECTA